MRTLALLVVPLLLVPTALALPGPLDGGGLDRISPLDDTIGGCPSQGCPLTVPNADDPAPLGRDATKAHVGGDCEPGAYAVACETQTCKTTYGIAAPCEETSTCYLHARSACVLGLNQRTVSPAVDYYATRVRMLQGLWPGLPTFHQPVEPSIAVGGDCQGHTVSVSCSLTPSPGQCVNVHPDDWFAPRDCVTERIWCTVAVQDLPPGPPLTNGCVHGVGVYIDSPACAGVHPSCDPCLLLDETSVTACEFRR